MKHFIQTGEGNSLARKFEKININHPQGDDLFLMANLYQDDTGLPMPIWVSERGHA